MNGTRVLLHHQGKGVSGVVHDGGGDRTGSTTSTIRRGVFAGIKRALDRPYTLPE